MPDQPEATTTTAARVLSDAEMIEDIRLGHANPRPGCPECLLLATLDAERQAREVAEAERDDNWNEYESLAARVAEYDTLLAAERQARERAEAALATERGRAETAEADIRRIVAVYHTRNPEGDFGADMRRLWRVYGVRKPDPLSQAAPHEPPILTNPLDLRVLDAPHEPPQGDE